jgi:hypothetical protein
VEYQCNLDQSAGLIHYQQSLLDFKMEVSQNLGLQGRWTLEDVSQSYKESFSRLRQLKVNHEVQPFSGKDSKRVFLVGNFFSVCRRYVDNIIRDLLGDILKRCLFSFSDKYCICCYLMII